MTPGAMGRLAAILLLASAPIANADMAIQAPQGGFVRDSAAKAIRPINGLPGGQVLGPALDLGFTVDQTVFAEGAEYAIAFSSDAPAAAMLITGLRSGQPVSRPLPRLAIQPTGLAKMNAGAAVLADADAGALQVWDGLPGAPVMVAALDGPGGKITAVAINRKRKTIAVGVTDGQTGFVYERTWASDAAWAVRDSIVQPIGLEYLPDGSGLFALDGASSTLRSIPNDGSPSPVAGAQDGLSAPVGFQILPASQQAAVAVANGLLFVDLTGAASPHLLPLNFTPTRCDWVDLSASLLLTEAGSGAVYLFDTSADQRVYFIPAN